MILNLDWRVILSAMIIENKYWMNNKNLTKMKKVILLLNFSVIFCMFFACNDDDKVVY